MTVVEKPRKRLRLFRQQKGEESVASLQHSVRDIQNQNTQVLPDDLVTAIAPLFRTEFNNLTMVTDKEDMRWTILRLLYEDSPIALFSLRQ